MRVGEAIAKIRKERKMTQEDFSKLFNVTRQTVSNWENEKSYPDLQTVVDISDMFHISLDVLLKGDRDMVKSFDKEIRQSKVFKNIIKTIGSAIILSILSIIICVIVWRNNEKDLLKHFQSGIHKQSFEFDKKLGYYHLEEDGIDYYIANHTELNLLDFTLDGVVDAKIEKSGVSIRVVNKDWIALNLNNTSIDFNVDENGSLIDNKISGSDKEIYNENKEQISLMVKKALDIYDSVYIDSIK